MEFIHPEDSFLLDNTCKEEPRESPYNYEDWPDIDVTGLSPLQKKLINEYGCLTFKTLGVHILAAIIFGFISYFYESTVVKIVACLTLVVICVTPPILNQMAIIVARKQAKLYSKEQRLSKTLKLYLQSLVGLNDNMLYAITNTSVIDANAIGVALHKNNKIIFHCKIKDCNKEKIYWFSQDEVFIDKNIAQEQSDFIKEKQIEVLSNIFYNKEQVLSIINSSEYKWFSRLPVFNNNNKHYSQESNYYHSLTNIPAMLLLIEFVLRQQLDNDGSLLDVNFINQAYWPWLCDRLADYLNSD